MISNSQNMDPNIANSSKQKTKPKQHPRTRNQHSRTNQKQTSKAKIPQISNHCPQKGALKRKTGSTNHLAMPKAGDIPTRLMTPAILFPDPAAIKDKHHVIKL
jgi:hypothetical protein